MHWLTRLIMETLPKPGRVSAPVKWFGGKGLFVRKLIPLVPKGKGYVEPYGGAASLLFHREPVSIEVYNDLDQDIVNLFRALQHPRRFIRLAHRITWTLYSRKEFERAVKTLQNHHSSPEARAWALYVAQNQGIGGLREHGLRGWGRVITPSGKSCKLTSAWRSKMAALARWHERLTKVMIECRNALDVISTWDSPDFVFYLDPPYVMSTRQSGKYVYEADDNHHERLIELILKAKGAVILSGYDSRLYLPLTKAGRDKKTFKTKCYVSTIKRPGGKKQKRASRTEVVWRNHRALEMLEEEREQNPGDGR